MTSATVPIQRLQRDCPKTQISRRPGSASRGVERALQRGIEAKEAHDDGAVGDGEGRVLTDQLVVLIACVDESNDAPNPQVAPRAARETRAHHHGVERVTVSGLGFGNGAVVHGTRQRRDEVDVAARRSFHEAEAGNLHDDVHGLG